MIDALASNRSNHSFHIGSLPRGARRRQNFADAHVSHLFSEMIAKDGIAVPQQVAREWGKGKCLPQLLSRPLRGWLGGHIEVQNAANFSGNDRIKLCAISFISQVYDLLTFWRGTALNASSLCFCGAGRGGVDKRGRPQLSFFCK